MKAKKQFQSQHEQLISTVKRIKMRNDAINKKYGGESSTRQLIEQVHKDKDFVVTEVDRLHNIVKDMQQRYMDPDSVRKLDAIKREARKQLNRNEYLVKDLIKNFHDVHGQEPPADKPITRKSPKKNNVYNTSELVSTSPIRPHKHQPKQQEEQIDVNYEMQHSLAIEKNKLLSEFEKSIVQVNGIMNDIADMTERQGEQLNIISDDIFTTKKHVELARENMQEANQYQKRSRAKYVMFTILIIIVVGLVIAFTVVL